MNCFIATFDILGYKEFILNNNKEFVDYYNKHIFRESQDAVSGGELISYGAGVAPDVSLSKVQCLHFSDTILFWTENVSAEGFQELLKVCSRFYTRTMQLTFAVRGAIGFGDVEFHPFEIQGKDGAVFRNASLYGKGLVTLYIEAEAQDWAGCVISESIFGAVDDQGDRIVTEQLIYEAISQKFIAFYPVPFKDGTREYRHCLRIIRSHLNNVFFRNMAKDIERIFASHLKGKPMPVAVKRKLQNTLDFLAHFRVEPDYLGQEPSGQPSVSTNADDTKKDEQTEPDGQSPTNE
ncbi:MAG: hypothetical protein EOP52_09425 [Sphingobacteriales bacterium]|nr:MAG: hypothetical protein EOP52_09425 [Sphingobacteriales bacterium]